MFAINIRQCVWVCSKIYTRHLRNGRRLGPVGANPGLDNRISAFTKEGLKIEDQDVEEFIEESESDFHNVGSAFDAHVNEYNASKDRLKKYIVKEKYFKDSMPNLLTWSEKEQIRHLAATDPNEWSSEKIAESFPVTIPIVKKLLKYPWKPASEKRIARHDATAVRNWRELKEGTLDIPDDVRQHMLKFSKRVIPPLKTTSVKIDLTQDKNIGEFEEIIQRCAANKTAQKVTEDNPSENHKSDYNECNRKTKTKQDKRLMTLEELTTNIKNRLKVGDNIDMPEKIIVDTIDSNATKDSQEIPREIILKDHTNTEKGVSEHKPEEKAVSPINYPERIRIPKQAYKKGATYKVNDCFYDHDGKFLYRVLGLQN